VKQVESYPHEPWQALLALWDKDAVVPRRAVVSRTWTVMADEDHEWYLMKYGFKCSSYAVNIHAYDTYQYQLSQ